MKTISIAAYGVAPYEVVIGHGLLQDAVVHVGPWLRRRRVALVSDETVAGIHGARVLDALNRAGIEADLLAVPPGESSKSMGMLTGVLGQLFQLGLDRRSTVMALGGGVVGDLAGLAAALFMRGIPVIQAPTTLLAQVDSSVGGKTAVDTPHGKNLIGAFHHPSRVLADLEVLDTLPDREMQAGMAEIIKAALLADANFFGWLEANAVDVLGRSSHSLEHAVGRSVEIKAGIVAEDPTEQGRRALLNLGHTFAHAIEVEAGYDTGAVLHGEAVAIGCVLAARLSERLGRISAADVERVERVMTACGLPTRIEGLGAFDADALIARMAGDKKAEAGAPTLILLNRLGEAEAVRGVDPADIRAVLA